MAPRTRNVLLALAGLVAALGYAWEAGLLRPAPARLRPTPAAR